MSLEVLYGINDFLTENSGVTGALLENALGGSPQSMRSYFFKPYKNTAETLSRAGSIVVAPVFLGLIGVEFGLIAVFSALNAIIELITLDTKAAENDFVESAVAFILMGVALFAAVTSPIINAVDLIGGGVVTLDQANEEELYEQGRFNPY